MSGEINGSANLDQLIGKLIERTDNLEDRLVEIKQAIDCLTDKHVRAVEMRIAALELRNAETKGGHRMLVTMCACAATIGGVIASALGNIWPH